LALTAVLVGSSTTYMGSNGFKKSRQKC
jgi:hypothetical protein